jgi:hypothetical protein
VWVSAVQCSAVVVSPLQTTTATKAGGDHHTADGGTASENALQYDWVMRGNNSLSASTHVSMAEVDDKTGLSQQQVGRR